MSSSGLFLLKIDKLLLLLQSHASTCFPWCLFNNFWSGEKMEKKKKNHFFCIWISVSITSGNIKSIDYDEIYCSHHYITTAITMHLCVFFYWINKKKKKSFTFTGYKCMKNSFLCLWSAILVISSQELKLGDNFLDPIIF